ncbi:MAG: hypothetical protein CMQ20_06670 [Gammaproteobacteria bacterium]|jgi:hypothetical protein|nr:hypothetical protein [Gammaproteobacteria bacterium]|tara:strand:- start:2290 stop:2754 length:465 start_codon:yes stop_codon:yes gene_type:complete
MMSKLMILAVFLACAGLFFIKGPDGTPLLTIDKLLGDLPSSPSDLLPKDAKQQAAPAVTKIYKWKDDNGVWQFSNSPVDEKGAEVMELDGKINTVEAFVAPAKDEMKKKPAAIPGVSTVSPQQAGNLLDTVKNLQETIDQRKSDMDSVSNMDDN